MKVVFRTNAGKEGLGHLNRIYSLYIALEKSSEKPLKAVFLVNEIGKNRLFDMGISQETIYTSEHYAQQDINFYESFLPDIIIIDTYKASNQYIRMVKNKSKAIIVLFDDNNSLYENIHTDVLVNGNIYGDILDYKEKIHCKIKLTGSQYLIMHPIYWNNTLNKENESNSILITCGGADPFGIMPNLIDWTRTIDLPKKIVIGPYFDKSIVDSIYEKVDKNYEIIAKPLGLKKYLEESQMILTAAGSTIYEVLSLGKMPIIFLMGEDQSLIAKTLESYGVTNLGWHHQITKETLEDALRETKEKAYHNNLLKLFHLFDGNGALRIANKIIFYYQKQKKDDRNDICKTN